MGERWRVYILPARHRPPPLEEVRGKEVLTMVREPGTRERRTHRRYYAEYVRTTSDEPQEQLQALVVVRQGAE